MGTWTAYTDGACRGNPGPSGCGALLISPDGEEFEFTVFMGEATNNQAEYGALVMALQKLIEFEAKDIHIKADSELMIKQLKKEYKVKNANILPLYQQAVELLTNFEKAKFEHVRREYNTEADRLANLAIDECE